MRFTAPTAPTPEAVADAAARSPFEVGPSFSTLASEDELRFRDEIEPELAGGDVLGWFARKELLEKLDYALAATRVNPAGTVVRARGRRLLALRRPEHVARRGARHRGRVLAPPPRGARADGDCRARRRPPAKVTRRLADFNAPGVPDASADLVVFDAAFHHAADRLHVAEVARRLLRPGGTLLLFREPTIALLRRHRDHGIEDDYGSFESEDTKRGYLKTLREAGFVGPRAVQAAGSLRERRFLLKPPASWLNGIAFAEYTYVARVR